MDVTEEQERRLARVKLVALDCDGVLTDGRLYYGANGESLKVFDVKDGQGIVSLLKKGIVVGVITARRSEALSVRSDELGMDFLVQGSSSKLEDLERVASENGVDLSETLFVGDDLGDLQVIKSKVIGVAVADATAEVIAAADIKTNKNGGCGAVREVSDAIIEAIKKFPVQSQISA